MKKIKIIGILLFLLLLVVYMYFPRLSSDDVQYWSPGWWQKSLFNVCKYKIPDNYEAIKYLEGRPGNPNDKYVVILKNKATNQYLVIARLRGFYYIDPREIAVGDVDFKQTNRFVRANVLPNFNIVIYQAFFPFLEQSNSAKLPDDLMLKGITVAEKEAYETSKTKVLYIKGDFTKLGFFKKMTFPWHFATPVFDFFVPQRGAIAIINNKEKNEAVVVVSAIAADKIYDENSIKDLIASLTFDKEPFVPYWPKGAKPTINQKIKLR